MCIVCVGVCWGLTVRRTLNPRKEEEEASSPNGILTVAKVGSQFTNGIFKRKGVCCVVRCRAITVPEPVPLWVYFAIL